MKVKVLRAFLMKGKRIEPDTELDISDRPLLGLLLSAEKVQPLEDVSQGGPMTRETAGALTGGSVDTEGASTKGKK